MDVKEARTGYQIVQGNTHDLPDVRAFIATLNALGTEQGPGLPIVEEHSPAFFDSNSELVITRAPGRLDVMGGIADYSGSLVLQLPLAEATLVALQKDANRTLSVISLTGEDGPISFTLPLSYFEKNGGQIEYDVARARFQSDRRTQWGAYVAGAFLVLMRERGARFDQGARLLTTSHVPQGKGVSSSAALEIAVMSAVAAAFDLDLNAHELALLCQKVENAVVGAPCGVMDQMTSACGEADRLLALLCQPAEVQGHISLPDDLRVWGLDSGVRHSVAGAAYTEVRTGAFMAYRIVAERAGLEVNRDNPGDNPNSQTLKIRDARWHGYLANMTPAEFEQHFSAHLPERMMGADFLQTYAGTTDAVTRVEPARSYAVRQPAAHAIYEHARVRAFAELLYAPASEQRRELLGELMYQSHASYSACGLGSVETDLLVRLVKDGGHALGLYGARITGGGSGGTVAILARTDVEASIAAVADAFERETNHECAIFSGSSPGSAAFGFLKLKREG